MGEWSYSSTIRDLGSRWMVDGQFHALVALPEGEEPPVPIA
jgi:hypothetical protein